MLAIPYLRAPVFRDGDTARFGHSVEPLGRKADGALLDRVFEGGADLEELAAELVAVGDASGLDAARNQLTEAFSQPDGIIGLIHIDVAPHYDVVLVEQGYGGVYVHTVELTKHLQREHSCLLISPVEPLFDDDGVTNAITLEGLRRTVPDLSYFSYVHIVRTLVRRTTAKLLLIAHRSQCLYLFDLIQRQPTIIYCDGFFDGLFRLSSDLKFPGGERSRKRVLEEIYYLVANGNPHFFGIWSTPTMNRYLLMAGYVSLRDARENWCWGAKQTTDFRSAFPKLRRPVRFMPPFTDPDLFQPELVERDRTVLFTTTMHNIEKKGFPELVEAMERLPEVHVRCVVRQPEKLPPYPERLEPRFTMGAVKKPEMVTLYHRVWLNCRTSREESSPVSILEAMVCEVPQIISPRVAEQITVLEDGKTGFVVDPDDVDALVEALRTLLADPELRDEMGREARRRALEYSYPARKKAFEKYLA